MHNQGLDITTCPTQYGILSKKHISWRKQKGGDSCPSFLLVAEEFSTLGAAAPQSIPQYALSVKLLLKDGLVNTNENII